MKMITFFVSSILLFTTSPLSFVQPRELLQTPLNATTTVLDLEGNHLQTKTNYYIFPAKGNDEGGGLALRSRNSTCPFSVVQQNLLSSRSLPLQFLPVNSDNKVVSLSSDLNIVFNAATICVQSTGWRLGGVDRITGRRYVTTGGIVGRPGVGTVSNWFKIKKHEDGYKIVHCPSVCDICKVVCGSVGVYHEDGKIWLGLSDKPLVVMFKKA